MSILDQLLGVQELDTTIDQLRHRRDHLPERQELVAVAAEADELARRRAEVIERADALSRSQKRLEDEIAMVEAKRSDTDARLYSGTITAPRELQALQDEVGALSRRTSELEDDLLEVLTATEPVDAELEELRADEERLAQRRAAVEQRLHAAEAEIDADLEEVLSRRAEAAGAVPDARLDDYERRRAQLGGIAVARLHGTSCGGCHLMLSAVEIDRIRKMSPDEPVTCEECGRLLVR